jgi:hypothetical protein
VAGILQVKDKHGRWVGIPAIVGPQGPQGPQGPAGTGTGDMLASVYDPQGKAQDVYRYADNAAADAVAKTGDTMSGPLRLQPDGVEGYSQVKKNATAEGDWGLQLQDTAADGSFMGMTICAASQKLEFKKKAAGDAEYSYPRIYSSDNPPEPDEVNAVPIWGGEMTGPLTLSGNPTSAFQAATKRYVDNTVEEAKPELMPASQFDAKTQADWEGYLEEGQIVWRLG